MAEVGLPGRRLRQVVPRLLGPGVAQRGRASRLGGHLPAAPAVSEPAPAGRVPPERAAGELTLRSAGGGGSPSGADLVRCHTGACTRPQPTWRRSRTCWTAARPRLAPPPAHH